jgi:hypothetical protein
MPPRAEAPGGPRDFRLYYADGQLQAAWDAATVPAGFSVAIELLDQQGDPLPSQPAIDSQDGHATIPTAQARPGDRFTARARLVSASTPAVGVTVRDVGPVTELTVSWSGGALQVSWSPPSGGPFGYDVTLLDADGHPVTPPPAPNLKGATASFDGEKLADGTAYVVTVRATQDNSLGPLVSAAPFTIDKSTPGSQRLRDLLARIKRARDDGNGNFGLSPALVQAEPITRQFGSLLGQEQDTLPVTGAPPPRSNADSVKVVGVADYPFGRGKTTELVFTDGDDGIVLTASIADLGNFTVPQLIERGIIPRSVYDPDVWGRDLTLPKLRASLDTRAGTLTFASDETAWSVPVGLAKVAVGNVTAAFQVVAPAEGEPRRYRPRVTSGLTFGQGTPLPVFVTLPAGHDGWVIGLDTGQADIGDLANFNPLMGGASPALPADVVALGNFKITSLLLAYGAGAVPDVWRLRAGFAVGPGPEAPWKILNVIEIKGISALLNVTLYRRGGDVDAAATGAVIGTLVVSERVKVTVAVMGPGADGAWRLSGSATVEDFSFTELAPYLRGNTTPLTDALAKLGTLEKLSLSNIAMTFVPEGANRGLRRLSVGVELKNWTIEALQPWFKIKEIFLLVDIDRPTQDDRVISGSVGGQLALPGLDVGVVVDFTQGDSWTLRLNAFAGQIAGLDALKDIVPSPSIKAFLPADLTNTSYGLGGFTLTYDSAAGYVREVTFLLNAHVGWKWLDGLLTLWEVAIDLRAARADKGKEFTVTGSLAGTIAIGDAQLTLAASRQGADDPWRFSGNLDREFTLDFNAVLAAWKTGLTLPSGYMLPQAITFVAARLEVAPTAKLLDFYAQARTDWSYDFGETKAAITEIGGEVHIAPKDGSGELTKTGAINGKFSLTKKGAINGESSAGSVHGFAKAELGSGKTDTVIAIEIDASKKQGVAALVNDVIPGAFDAAPVPKGFQAPRSVTGAALRLNLTRGELLLTGQYAAEDGSADGFYGAVALLVVDRAQTQPNPPPDPRWGFILAGVLANWKLADISPALEGVDQVLGLKRATAAIAISRLDDAAGDLVSAHVPTLPSALSIKRGLNFYVELDLAGGLLANLRPILDISGKYSLAGHIPADSTAPLTLTARLGQLTLLQWLTFEAVTLIYVRTPPPANAPSPASPAPSLSLDGTIKVPAIFGKNYNFQGSLTLTSAAIKGSLALLPTDPNKTVDGPWSLPGIVIDQLGVSVEKTFATSSNGGTPGTTRIALVGEVRLGRPPLPNTTDRRPSFQAKLGLAGGTPVLMSIALHSDLDIGGFLAQCFTGDAANWPADFIDLTFKEGSRVYYFKDKDKDKVIPGADAWKTEPASGKLLAYTYEPGFNVDAHVELTLVKQTLKLRFTLNSVDGSDGKPGGVKASVGLDQAIDLLFVELAGSVLKDDAYTGGPTLVINTSTKTFGFSTGVNFFGKGFLAATVGVSSNIARDTLVTGHLKTAASLPVFGGLEFDFLYTRKATGPERDRDSFAITNWPAFKVFDQLIDIVKEIRKLASLGTGCGQLAEWGTNSLNTDYSVTPAAGLEGGQLAFSLTVTCSMFLGSTSNPFLTCELPPIKVLVPKGTQFKSLAGLLTQGIVEAAPRFVGDLLRQPEKIALFLAVVYGKEGVKIALELGCRALVDAAVASATAAAAELLAKGGAVATVWTVINTVISSHPSDPGTRPGDPKPEDPIPSKPSMTDFTFDQDAFTGRWTGAAYAASYEFKVSGPQQYEKKAPAVPALTNSVPAGGRSLVAGTYYGCVRGVRESREGPWSDPKTLDYQPKTPDLQKLVAPAVQLAYDGAADLVATWTPLPGGSWTYDLRLFLEGVRLPAMDRTVPGGGTERWPLAGLTPGHYTAQLAVRGDATHIASDWSGPSNAVVKLEPPDVQALTYADDRVSAAWLDNPSAGGYDPRLVLDGDLRTGAHAVMPVSISRTNALFDASPLAVGTYRVQVLATVAAPAPAPPASAATAPSDWSAPSSRSLAKLPMPAVPSVAVDRTEERLNVTVAEVPGANLYLARLVRDGASPGPTVAAERMTRVAWLPCPAIWQGGPARVEVRAAKADGSAIASNWQAAAGPIVRLNSPTNIVLAFNHAEGIAAVTVRPSAMPPASVAAQPNQYQARFFAGSPWEPVGPPLDVRVVGMDPATDVLLVPLPTGPGLPAGPVRIEVRSVVSDPAIVPSVWADAPQVLTRLERAVILGAASDPATGMVQVTLQQAASTTTMYQAQLAAVGHGPVGQPPSPQSMPALSLAAVDLAPGAYTVRARLASRDEMVIDGDWTDWNPPQPLTVPPAPANPTLTWDSVHDSLSVSFTRVAGPEAHEAQLLAATRPIGTPQPVPVPQPGLTTLAAWVPLPDNLPAGNIAVRVRSTGPAPLTIPGAWVTSAVALIRLDAPVIVDLRNNAPRDDAPNVIWVTYDPVTDAGGYFLRCWPQNRPPLGELDGAVAVPDVPPPGSIPPGTVTGRVLGGELVIDDAIPPGVLHVQVKSKSKSDGHSIPSRWATSEQSLTRLPAPGVRGFKVESGVLYLTPEGPDATELRYIQGRLIGHSPSIWLAIAEEGWARHPGSLPLNIASVQPGIYTLELRWVGRSNVINSVWRRAPQLVVLPVPPTLPDLADRLRAAGLSAQQAAPTLRAYYDLTALKMVGVLDSRFPESAHTADQLAWALRLANYGSDEAAQALRATNPGASQAEIAAGIKAGYPAQALLDRAGELQRRGYTAQTASSEFRSIDPTLTAVQMAILLTDTFASTAATPLQLAQALKGGVAEAKDLVAALRLARPDATSRDVAEALRDPQVYPNLTAAQMGRVLKAPGVFPALGALEMRVALGGAGFAPADVDGTISEIFLLCRIGPAGWVQPGPKGGAFDDTDAALGLGLPPSKIQIRHSDFINTIQVFYGGESHPLPRHGDDIHPGPFAVTDITLDPGDAVVRLSGYADLLPDGYYILQLMIQTRNGRTYGPFGREQARTPFALELKPNESLIALFGSVRWSRRYQASCLSAIGMTVSGS